jgi:hypothetical protein
MEVRPNVVYHAQLCAGACRKNRVISFVCHDVLKDRRKDDDGDDE